MGLTRADGLAAANLAVFRRPVKRQGERELAAGPNRALHPDAPTMHLHESFGQREPEAGAFDGLARTGLLELLEDAILVLASDADTGVADRDLHGIVHPSRRERHVS